MKASGYRLTAWIGLGVVAPLVVLTLAGYLEIHRPAGLWTLLVLPYWPWVASRSLAGATPRVMRASLALRTLLSLLIAGAMADVRFVRGDQSLTVNFVLDYSASVPEAMRAEQLAYVNEAAKRLPPGDRAGLVVFGENASVEVIPSASLQVERLFAEVRSDYTNVQQALELAAAAFPSSGRRKIVLLTDGNENAGSLTDAAESLAASGIALDVLPLRREDSAEIMIDNLILPESVRDGEAFEVRARIMSRTAGPAEVVCLADGEVIERRQVQLTAGANVVRFAPSVRGGGFHAVTVRVAGAADTLTGNNSYVGVTYVKGPARVLMVAPTPREVAPLAAVCTDAGLVVRHVTPESFPADPVELYGYDCIVLANVAAGAFTADALAQIESGVRELGVGLIMLGGEDSFAAGGWDGTPIAKALPVSLEPNRKRQVPKGALVLILHTCEFPNGNYWAKEISKASLRTLSAQDEAGLIYFSPNQNETWLFPLTSMREEKIMGALIDGCEPGDMISFAPAFSLALDGLKKSDAASRHVIVISDGDPSKPKAGDVAALAAAGVTVSTVAVNPHSPRDLEIMQDLAEKTNGRYYLVKDPRTLPAVFIREARRVQRGTILLEPFRPALADPSVVTDVLQGQHLPTLYGRVAASIRERATTALVTTDEYRDPVLAHWQYGLGRAVAFTSDAGTSWSREWAAWDRGSRMWQTLFEWVSRPARSDDLAIRTRTDGDRGIVTIDAVDADGRYRNNLSFSANLAGTQLKPLTVSRVAPGQYQAEFPLGGVGVDMVSLAWRDPESGAQGVANAAISVPYPPEYRVFTANLPLLHEAASIVGGRVLAGDPKTDPVFAAAVPALENPLLLYGLIAALAAALFFADVAVRRLVLRRQDLQRLLKPGDRESAKPARDDAVARLRQGRQPAPPVATVVTPANPADSATSDPKPSLAADKPASTPDPNDEKSSEEDESGDAPSYTSRLLAAKKRKKPER